MYEKRSVLVIGVVFSLTLVMSHFFGITEGVFILALALILSHYLEPILMKILVKFRNMIYFKRRNHINGVKVYYKFLDEPVINPVTVAQKALWDAEIFLIDKYFPKYKHFAYKSISEPSRDRILNIANWFWENYKVKVEKIDDLEVIRFEYNFDNPVYGIKKPWYSGMAQGHVAILGLAAYVMTGDERYMDLARLAGRLLKVDIDKGGVKENLCGGFWYEEYASPSLKPNEYPRVLNGHIFALDGLFWLSQIDREDVSWQDLFLNGVRALENCVSKYDAFFWSYHDLRGNFAHCGYHSLHIKQLDRVANFYSKIKQINFNNIKKYKKKFELYRIIPFGFAGRLILQSNNMVIAIFTINFSLI